MFPLAWAWDTQLTALKVYRLTSSGRLGIRELCHARLVLYSASMRLAATRNRPRAQCKWLGSLSSTCRNGLSLPDNTAVQSCTNSACQFVRVPGHLLGVEASHCHCDNCHSCTVAHRCVLAKAFPGMCHNVYNAAALSSSIAAKYTECWCHPSVFTQWMGPEFLLIRKGNDSSMFYMHTHPVIYTLLARSGEKKKKTFSLSETDTKK